MYMLPLSLLEALTNLTSTKLITIREVLIVCLDEQCRNTDQSICNSGSQKVSTMNLQQPFQRFWEAESQRTNFITSTLSLFPGLGTYVGSYCPFGATIATHLIALIPLSL